MELFEDPQDNPTTPLCLCVRDLRRVSGRNPETGAGAVSHERPIIPGVILSFTAMNIIYNQLSDHSSTTWKEFYADFGQNAIDKLWLCYNSVQVHYSLVPKDSNDFRAFVWQLNELHLWTKEQDFNTSYFISTFIESVVSRYRLNYDASNPEKLYFN